MVKVKGMPDDLAPDCSVAAGRMEYRQAMKYTAISERLKKAGINFNDEFQLIIKKQSKLPRQERDAVCAFIMNRAMQKASDEKAEEIKMMEDADDKKIIAESLSKS